jgi:hypothetical protein
MENWLMDAYALSMIWISIWCEATGPLENLKRFPDMATCREFVEYNKGYQAHLKSRSMCQPREWRWFAAAEEESKYLCCVYCQLHDAQNENLDLEYRLKCLRYFHELVGDEAYFLGGGYLPPPVPIWRMPIKY